MCYNIDETVIFYKAFSLYCVEATEKRLCGLLGAPVFITATKTAYVKGSR